MHATEQTILKEKSILHCKDDMIYDMILIVYLLLLKNISEGYEVRDGVMLGISCLCLCILTSTPHLN